MSLATSFSDMGKEVGLLDLDIHGPSVPQVFRTDEPLRATKLGFEPVRVRGIEIMSLGYLIQSSPIPLGGRGKESLIKMMIALTNWSDLDYLVVDLPPGTGDEMILAIRALKHHKRSGALLVTLPSRLSMAVVKRALALLRDEGVNVLGLVENMAYIRCDGGIMRPFGSLDSPLDTELLGSIPLYPDFEESLLSGDFPRRVPEEVRAPFLKLASLIESKLKVI